ncbi:acyl-CoA reductase [Palleronia caenipelagi]|nr:acyl-CoA reductase [Palleronia caenipelagi]
MPNHEDNNIKDIRTLTPCELNVNDLLGLETLSPFSDIALDFSAAFSRQIMKRPEIRRFPEIVALADWLRPRNLAKIQAAYFKDADESRVFAARGIALHFAPANVDTIFLYSTMISCLVGNINIVRVSSRSGDQLRILIQVLSEVLNDKKFANLKSRLFVIQYEHNDLITMRLSKIADVRVIWGGDNAVAKIRQFPLSMRGKDVVFPDRWSLAVLDTNAVSRLSDGELATLSEKFCNDSYWFGQMACSSPQAVFWVESGPENRDVKARFWNSVSTAAQKFSDEVYPVDFVNKLVEQDQLAIDGLVEYIYKMPTNLASVGSLNAPDIVNIHEKHVGSGIFWEYTLESLEELPRMLTSKSQTISSYGISSERWRTIARNHEINIDRIVPTGLALKFDAVWDGMDLLREFSRIIYIAESGLWH